MRAKIYIFLIILMGTSNLWGQRDEPKISGSFNNIPFGQFVEQIEKKYNFHFFYKDEWVNDIMVNQVFSDNPVNRALDSIFTGENIYFHIDSQNNIFLTPGIPIKSSLYRQFNQEEYVIEEVEEDSGLKTETEGGIITLGNQSGDKKSKITIIGNVKDFDSGEPVIGAVVYIPELSAGTMTDSWGYYSITIPSGLYRVEYSCLGFKKRDAIVNAFDDGRIDMEMKYQLIPLKEVTITANADFVLRRSEIGFEKLDIKDINLLPTTLGETDIIKTVLFLPGVLSVGEASQGFNVRGGSADQNMVLLYNSPIFNTSHFFGFFSAVNPAVIRDVSLYKGGIPARFGGRISSVLDIVPKAGNMRKLEGSAGISPITSQFSIEGPLIKDKTSFILAARSTYSNWILKMMEDPFISNSRASFYDINSHLVHILKNNDKIELSAYSSSDRFKFNRDTLYSYNNKILSVGWRHIISSRLQSDFDAGLSSYNYNIESSMDKINAFSLYHRISQASFRGNFSYTPNLRHKISFGINLSNYSVLPGQLKPTSDSSLVIPTIVDRQRGVESALYFSDIFDITPNFTVNAGLRFSSFTVIGPGKVYEYDPRFPKSDYTVTDSTMYNKAGIVKTYGGPEIRLSSTLMLNSLTSVKVSYNHTRQYIHQLSNTTSVSPTDIWVLSTSHMKPQVGDQIAFGLYRNFHESYYETSVEVYYKNIRNMIDFKSGSKLLLNENIERDVVNTIGKAYGFELMIRKKKGQLNGWISYTYSRILMKSDTRFVSEIINNGNYFPANYDKPNSLTIIGNYRFSRRLNLSTTYTYTSGRPITYPVASYEYYDINLLHYSERNRYRIPDYSRLDLSLTLSFNLKSTKIGHSSFTASLYNVLGRSNVYSVFFRNEKSQVKGYQLSVFARPIPSITYNIDF